MMLPVEKGDKIFSFATFEVEPDVQSWGLDPTAERKIFAWLGRVLRHRFVLFADWFWALRGGW